MKKTQQTIVTIALVVALLSAGLPTISREDINRDSRVDLSDSILSVKNFTEVTENPADFEDKLKQMVIAIQVTAGMQTIIKKSDESRPGWSFAGLDFSCLWSLSILPDTSEFSFYKNRDLINYQSITVIPSSPPPQFG